MKLLQRGLIFVMICMWIRSIYKWFANERVGPTYYFLSTTLSLIICISVMMIEYYLNLQKGTGWTSENP